jgi:hypothetical protein
MIVSFMIVPVVVLVVAVTVPFMMVMMAFTNVLDRRLRRNIFL